MQLRLEMLPTLLSCVPIMEGLVTSCLINFTMYSLISSLTKWFSLTLMLNKTYSFL